jgi:serine/threonine protein phosphatase PrpC
VTVGHVGDSRAYRMRDGALTQLTRDHSLVNDCIDAMPHLTEKQRAELPKNVITRALGMQDQVTVDLLNDVPRPGDLYLLCSDGLSGMLTDEEMVDVIGAVRAAVPRSKVPEALCRRLVERANENGGEDNVTALVIQFEGEGDDDDDVLAITAPDAAATPDDVAAPTERAEGVRREARAGEASGVDGAADSAADTRADGADGQAGEPSEASEGALTHGDGPRSSDASQAPPE